jgi:hypothetical protein
MAYITVSNSKKMIRQLNESKLDEIEGNVYKWDIYFFSKRERVILKGIRELLKDPEKFAAEYYEPIEVVDSLRYVFPESQPSYHTDNTCPRLQSNFKNFIIPEIIRERGKEEIIKFRNWFNENKNLLETDIVKFIYSLQLKFIYVGEINPKSIDYSNSGIDEKENYSIPELESKIDNLLREAGHYFTDNPEKQQIIRRFQKLTFLAYIHGDIYNNDTGLNDSELKTFLRYYDEKFKLPVKEYLIEYYRLLHNPDMTFDGQLLDKLGFRPCGACFGGGFNYLPHDIDTTEIHDDLPF